MSRFLLRRTSEFHTCRSLIHWRSRQIALKRNVTESYSQVQTNTLLDPKQNLITNGSLSIARTSGLQAALASKHNLITDRSLSIARTNDLQGALDSKQPTIADGGLSIAKTSGLQSALRQKVDLTTFNTANQQRITVDATLEALINTKANTADVFTQSQVNSLVNAKLNIVSDSDLTIAKTSGF